VINALDKRVMDSDKDVLVIRHRFPSLRSLGVAVEYFPDYHNYKCGLHAIDVVVFSVALRGRGKHYIDQDAFDMGPGCVGITSYGQRHDIVTTRRGMEKFNVYLDVRTHVLPELPSPLREVLLTMIPPRRTLQHRLNRAFQFRTTDTQQLRQTLQRMEREIRDRRPGYAEVVRGCLTSFLIDCCRSAQESGLVLLESQDTTFPNWVADLRTSLDQRFNEAWTLGGISKAYGISVGHLCRTFAAYTGKTLVEYLIDRRIGSAMTRLETGNCKVSRIAAELGFNDGSYFHRQFKQRTGHTPVQYRRKQQRSPAGRP
jgi:AraC-like DNA-binding protein